MKSLDDRFLSKHTAGVESMCSIIFGLFPSRLSVVSISGQHNLSACAAAQTSAPVDGPMLSTVDGPMLSTVDGPMLSNNALLPARSGTSTRMSTFANPRCGHGQHHNKLVFGLLDVFRTVSLQYVHRL
eukprot:Lankesteria_metandrocarpae@DN8320_c0_g1_i1.p1